MIELKEYNNSKYASAKVIYDYLEVKKRFGEWISKSIANANLKEHSDFVTCKLQSTGGRPIMDYLLTKRASIRIVLQSRMAKSIDLETEILDAFEEKQTGILLNADQVSVLTDMVKAMTLVSEQKKAEKGHFEFKNFSKSADWWKYRADLLGYSVASLKEALAKIGKKYNSQKKALMHIDKSEIIRTGVIDLLITLGRNEEYALNVAEFAKVIAEKNGYHLQIWDDTKPNPLGLNQNVVNERKKLI